MANVGSGLPGKTLIGTGNGASPSYASIGTNSGLTAHGVLVAENMGAFAATGTGSVGQVLQSQGSGADPAYSTATYPSTTTINQLLYSPSANSVSGLSTTSDGVLITSGTGVPSWLPNGIAGQVLTANTGAPPSWTPVSGGTVTSVTGTPNRITSTGGTTPQIDISSSYVGQTSINTLGTVTTGTWNADTITVPFGGLGDTSLTPYAVLCGGTTSTSAVQSVSGVGTSGQVLTSNGPASLPTFQTVAGVAANPIGAYNLGITYSSPNFSLTSANGTSLATSNGAIVMNTITRGQVQQFPVTMNYSFIDSTGASQLTGNTFGFTSGVTQTTTPFYLYAVVNTAATAVTFCISRIPNSLIAPVASTFGKASSAVCSTQGSFWCLDNTVTVADYAQNPCMLIGSFRMTYNGSDWAVTAIDNRDGIGLWNDQRFFGLSLGQFGANAGTLMVQGGGGGTLPTPVNQAVSYTITKDGRVGWQFTSQFLAIGTSTNGLIIVCPFLYTASIAVNPLQSSGIATLNGTNFYSVTNNSTSGSNIFQQFYINGSRILYNSITTTTSMLIGSIYQAATL